MKKFYKKATALLLTAAMLGGSQTIAWASENFSSAPEDILFSDGAEFESQENIETVEIENSQEIFSTAEDAYLPFIQTKRIPYGKAGEPYSVQLEAKGSGKISWSMGQDSAVPKGLTLSETGVLSGTPTEAGEFILYIQASVGEAKSVRKITLYIERNEELLPDYDVEIDKWFTGDFGEIYAVSGGDRSVSFYNRGKKPVHFKELPECKYFNLTWLGKDKGVLGDESYIDLEIRVEDGLAQGSYEESITLETQEGLTFPFTLKVTILPASSKEYDLSCSPNIVEFNKKFFDEESDSKYTVLVTNIGTKETYVRVYDDKLVNFCVKTNSFDQQEEPKVLKPGESQKFYVEPKHFYGTYDKEVFCFETDDGSEFPIQVSMNYEKPKAPLEITPYQVKFSDIYVSAKEGPEPIKVIIRNKSDEKMRLELDPGEPFRVSKLSREGLEPGETTEFNVWPENGLPAGNYSTVIRIRMKFESGWEESFLQDVMVNVGERLFAGVLPFESIKNVPNGTEKTEKALGLPKSLKVYGEDKKTTFQVPVRWYLDECSYNPENKEAQTFQVQGVLVLKPGENGNHLDTAVSMEVQVNAYQAIGIPVIKKAAAVTNYASVSLTGKVKEAEGYQFVVVNTPEDLENENFLAVKKTDKLSGNVKYIPQGEHILYCRGYRGEKDSMEYGGWSEGKEINVKYTTPQAPAINSHGVSNCDIRLYISTPEKVDGFDVVVAKTYEGTEPVDYALVKTSYPGNSKTITISGVPKGKYYVGIHSYRKIGGVKILSRWSNLIYTNISKSLVKTAPVIKKAAVSRRNLTVQSAVPKGTDGYDWVLARKCVKNKNGTYTPSNYAYIQKNKKTANITFKNLRPGTYYLTGHAYVKGYQKNLGNWAKPRKIVIK